MIKMPLKLKVWQWWVDNEGWSLSETYYLI
jgi:hypothetical protein